MQDFCPSTVIMNLYEPKPCTLKPAIPRTSRLKSFRIKWPSNPNMTWLTSEPPPKSSTFSLLIMVHIETPKVKVLRANQKNAKLNILFSKSDSSSERR